jgi:hypothetical protein
VLALTLLAPPALFVAIHLAGAATPATRPDEPAAPVTQPDRMTVPATQPDGSAAPATQPGDAAKVQRCKLYLAVLSQGVNAYKATFQAYPPSEPDMVDARKDWIKNNLAGFYGPAALRLYLTGRTGDGYMQRHDTVNWTGAGNADYEREKKWDPFVSGLPVDKKKYLPMRKEADALEGAFVDPWGNPFEYFVAYRTRGATTADIYPRAVGISPEGQGPYKYPTARDTVIEGYRIRIPVQRWKDGWSKHDAEGQWARHSIPVNATTFLIVSAGPDGKFGTDDDIGNWD